MTVSQLVARLKHYPPDTKILILAGTNHVEYPNTGIDIRAELVATFIRPDFESVPSSVFLVPEQPLVKAS